MKYIIEIDCDDATFWADYPKSKPGKVVESILIDFMWDWWNTSVERKLPVGDIKNRRGNTVGFAKIEE